MNIAEHFPISTGYEWGDFVKKFHFDSRDGAENLMQWVNNYYGEEIITGNHSAIEFAIGFAATMWWHDKGAKLIKHPGGWKDVLGTSATEWTSFYDKGMAIKLKCKKSRMKLHPFSENIKVTTMAEGNVIFSPITEDKMILNLEDDAKYENILMSIEDYTHLQQAKKMYKDSQRLGIL